MKKQKQKKAGIKKEENTSSAAPPAKADEPETVTEESAPANDSTETAQQDDDDAANIQEEPMPESNGEVPQRQPSLSLQSKMRSSSFRQSAGGPMSPSYGFSPDGDTAPEIHRKQAARIEELEKETKRLAKEASEGERRWKKAEGALEELREAEDEGAENSTKGGGSAELGKLVNKLNIYC